MDLLLVEKPLKLQNAKRIDGNTTSGRELLPANPDRRKLVIQNSGTSTLYVDFQRGVSKDVHAVSIPSKGHYVFEGNVVDAVFAVFESSATGFAHARDFGVVEDS